MYLYWDRPLFLEFLHSRRFDSVGNILEDAIFTMLSCVEMVGEIRARAIIQDKIVDALRFFSGSKKLAWGPLDMSHVYNVLEKVLTLVKENGAMLIDANLDVWADFSDCDAYVDWNKHRSEETTMLVVAFDTTSTGGADATTSKGTGAFSLQVGSTTEHARPKPRSNERRGSVLKESVLGGMLHTVPL